MLEGAPLFKTQSVLWWGPLTQKMGFHSQRKWYPVITLLATPRKECTTLKLQPWRYIQGGDGAAHHTHTTCTYIWSITFPFSNRFRSWQITSCFASGIVYSLVATCFPHIPVIYVLYTTWEQLYHVSHRLVSHGRCKQRWSNGLTDFFIFSPQNCSVAIIDNFCADIHCPPMMKTSVFWWTFDILCDSLSWWKWIVWKAIR